MNKHVKNANNDRRTPKKNNRMPFWRKVIWLVVKLLLFILRVMVGFDDE